jgi:hypothetical protein
LPSLGRSPWVDRLWVSYPFFPPTWAPRWIVIGTAPTKVPAPASALSIMSDSSVYTSSTTAPSLLWHGCHSPETRGAPTEADAPPRLLESCRHGKAPRLGTDKLAGLYRFRWPTLTIRPPKPREENPGAPGVRVTVVSAFHRSEVERPPRTTVGSTVWKGSL